MMGGTGDGDRKRQFGSISSPTAAKKPTAPINEFETALLIIQNQRIFQKLESKKVEYVALENKWYQLREKQLPYNKTLSVLEKSLDELVDAVESCSLRMKGLASHGCDNKHHPDVGDNGALPPEDFFLHQLCATESSYENSSISPQMRECLDSVGEKVQNTFRNIVHIIDGVWSMLEGLYAKSIKQLPEGSCTPNSSIEFEREVKNMRLTLGDMHMKHRSLARKMQLHRDTDAKNKSELRQLKGELECTIAELEESKASVILGNECVANDGTRDKEKDPLKELQDQASFSEQKLKRLHEERLEILKNISSLQNTLKNVKSVFSSEAFVLVKDQIAKAKEDIAQYQALFEKLQVEKDNLGWREKEVKMKNDIVDVMRRASSVSDSRISDLKLEIQKQNDRRKSMVAKLEEASREPGRKELRANFRISLLSFAENMRNMEIKSSKYMEASADVPLLRAKVQSLSTVLDRKTKELEALSGRSAAQSSEMQKLQSTIRDLEEDDLELKAILDVYVRETSYSREELEARNAEYKACAHVQSLTYSLDEHQFETRARTAIEAEAASKQMIAAAEEKIAYLRLSIERSKREKGRLSDVIERQHGICEAYFSEFESIHKETNVLQAENERLLLEEITKREDYKIKLVLEGVRARQLRDSVLLDKQTMERKIQQENALINFFQTKAERIEDQMKSCSDQVQKLSETRVQKTSALENTRRSLQDIRRTTQQIMDSLEEAQSKVDESRINLADLQIKLEKERFDKKRVEEKLKAARRKHSQLTSEQEDGSYVVEKLQQELKEYNEFLNCSVCLDRRKEVVITKCYHLFCKTCVEKAVKKAVERQQPKCPLCATSFRANDVKRVYYI